MKLNEALSKVENYIVKSVNVEEFAAMKKMAFYFCSSPGVGKSEGIAEMGQRIEKLTGKKVYVHDVRLSLFAQTDLRGIPVPDESRTKAKWLIPEIFQMDDSPNVINLLFLDELSSCAPGLMAAAYQIVLDRKLNEHQLPDNCFVMAAGNRMQDKSVVYKMPAALANRLIHFDIECDVDAWKEWAYTHDIDPKIISFINFKPNLLNTEIDSKYSGNAFATPRTWSMSDRLLKIYGNVDEAYDCIVRCIGVGAASEFKRFCNTYLRIPNIDDIAAGKEVDCPSETDIQYALSGAIVNRMKKATDAEISNIIKFAIDKMPEEISVLTMKDAIIAESADGKSLKLKIIRNKQFQIWAKRFSKFIL